MNDTEIHIFLKREFYDNIYTGRIPEIAQQRTTKLRL